ncbi:protein FAR1-RELATED SEQUENCE 1-like [Corylus avellana]|uniref:protein FAR1-RELATED SEQUENCE 1-like n=1 Tax=Corylus avellana TaxID=13451 RepID=UPI00286CB134|nr:protein FAR1-RELATED SEQUENCE 1-like [Corylus avellana]
MYTPVIFEKIHDEYDYASVTIIKHCSESQFMHEYIVALYEKDKEYKVIFNRDNKIISCSCMKFETFGILYCHALKVFDLLNIKIIPDTYILKRWTREAKSGHIYVKTRNVEEDVNLNVAQRYRKLCPRVVKVVAEAADNDEAYAVVEGMLEEMEKHVQDIKNSSTTDNEAHMSLPNSNETAIHTPYVENLLETVKGIKKKEGWKCGKRFRSWVENQSKNNTKITTKNNVGEKFFQEINCSLNIQDGNSTSHAKCYSRQRIEQVPYSVPMITSEEPFGDRPETGFIEFLQVTDGFNLTPTPPVDSANTNMNLRNFLSK